MTDTTPTRRTFLTTLATSTALTTTAAARDPEPTTTTGAEEEPERYTVEAWPECTDIDMDIRIANSFPHKVRVSALALDGKTLTHALDLFTGKTERTIPADSTLRIPQADPGEYGFVVVDPTTGVAERVTNGGRVLGNGPLHLDCTSDRQTLAKRPTDTYNAGGESDDSDVLADTTDAIGETITDATNAITDILGNGDDE